MSEGNYQLVCKGKIFLWLMLGGLLLLTIAILALIFLIRMGGVGMLDFAALFFVCTAIGAVFLVIRSILDSFVVVILTEKSLVVKKNKQKRVVLLDTISEIRFGDFKRNLIVPEDSRLFSLMIITNSGKKFTFYKGNLCNFFPLCQKLGSVFVKK